MRRVLGVPRSGFLAPRTRPLARDEQQASYAGAGIRLRQYGIPRRADQDRLLPAGEHRHSPQFTVPGFHSPVHVFMSVVTLGLSNNRGFPACPRRSCIHACRMSGIAHACWTHCACCGKKAPSNSGSHVSLPAVYGSRASSLLRLRRVEGEQSLRQFALNALAGHRAVGWVQFHADRAPAEGSGHGACGA